MTFNIGELQGTLELDAAGMDPGIAEALAKVQGFVRSGETAAKAAGKKIGEGLKPDTTSLTKALADIEKTLDQQTGAVTKNTRAWAANEIGADKLRDLEKLGVATRDYIDAITGVPGAQERMQRSLEGNADALRDLDRMTSQVAQSQQNLAATTRAVGNSSQEAGGEVGKFGDGLKGFSDKLDGVIGKIQEFGAGGKAAAAAAGAVIGAGLALAIAAAFEGDTITRKIQATLGATEQEAGRLGKAAGSLFAKNYGDSMEEVGQAVVSVVKNMEGLGNVSSSVLESITGQVISVSKVFDQDFNEVTRAAGQLMKTGLAKNAQEALDLITKGFQSPVNAAGDLLDTFNEYSTVFRSLGLNGKDALGVLSQGLKAGARDADIVADSLKEMLLRIQDGSSRQAIQSLGLNFSAALEAISKGGESAKTATDTIIDALRNVQDPAQRAALAVGIFGTKAEDMQQAINGIDVDKAASQFEQAYGKIAGAAAGLDSVVGGSLQGAFEGVWRSMQGFISEAGSNLAPFLVAAAAAFSLLFNILQGALSWLGDLPGPIYLVGAAVAVWATWGAITAGAQALVAALAAMGVAARGLLVSLGPIAILMLGVGTAMAFLADNGNAVEEAVAAQKQHFEDLRATLDQTTGSITANTTALIKKQAIDSGMADTLSKAGISLELYSQAALGNVGAQEALAAAINKAKTEALTSDGAFSGMKETFHSAGVSAEELFQAINSGDWGSVTAKVQAYAEAQGRLSGDASTTTGIMEQFTSSIQGATGPVSALDSILGQAGNTSSELATAQADAAAMTAGTGEAAGAAYDRLLALATVGKLSADEIQRMGVEAGLTAPQIAAVQEKAAGAAGDIVPMTQALSDASAAASELDSLVQFLALSLDRMSGGTISAEQATRANEAALREVASAVRDATDAEAKKAEAQAAVNALTEQGVTSGADYDAAQRALTDATNGAADASDKQFDSTLRARDSALEMASAAYATAAANGDLQGAAAAATAVIEGQRQRFIAAQPEADRLSGKADEVARSLYGIPGAVATTIAEQGASYVQSQANNTTGAVNNIPGFKGVTIDAGGNAQAVINGISVSLANMQSYKQIVIETIHRNMIAVSSGGQIGQVMGLPGFASGGQVPGTPPSDPRQDNVLASAMGQPIMLRSKEWVQPQEAVDYYGPNFMRAVQHRAFPKPEGYADGGPITPMGSAARSRMDITLTLRGEGEITDALARQATVVVTDAFRDFALELERV